MFLLLSAFVAGHAIRFLRVQRNIDVYDPSGETVNLSAGKSLVVDFGSLNGFLYVRSNVSVKVVAREFEEQFHRVPGLVTEALVLLGSEVEIFTEELAAASITVVYGTFDYTWKGCDTVVVDTSERYTLKAIERGKPVCLVSARHGDVVVSGDFKDASGTEPIAVWAKGEGLSFSGEIRDGAVAFTSNGAAVVRLESKEAMENFTLAVDWEKDPLETPGYTADAATSQFSVFANGELQNLTLAGTSEYPPALFTLEPQAAVMGGWSTLIATTAVWSGVLLGFLVVYIASVARLIAHFRRQRESTVANEEQIHMEPPYVEPQDGAVRPLDTPLAMPPPGNPEPKPQYMDTGKTDFTPYANGANPYLDAKNPYAQNDFDDFSEVKW